MDGLSLVAATVGVLALACVPLLLPWPQRVRWTTAAHAMNQGGASFAMSPPLDLREVELVSVDVRGSTLTVSVLEAGHPPSHTLTFACTTSVSTDLVAMLREWQALRTPMLLLIDAAGVACLDGPVAAVANLRSVGGRSSTEVDERREESATFFGPGANDPQKL